MKHDQVLLHFILQASIYKKSLPIRVAAVFLSGLLLLSVGCEKKESATNQSPAPVAVRVAPALQQDLASRIGYVGTVHSRREVKVLAQTAGAVVWLAGEGETVRAAEMVARITAPEIAARSSRMDAELERAQTEREFLCGTYETDKKLVEAGVITQRQVDMSKRACDAADAALSAARAGQREIGATQGKTAERAPFGGLVLQWLVEPGQNVMPGMPLLLLGGQDRELRVHVAEGDLDRGVREGLHAMVRLGGETQRLQVAGIAPLALGPGRTFEVRIPLPDELRAVPAHGTSARVDFLIAEVAKAVAIPERALTRAEGADAVFVIDDDRARLVKVIPGIRDGGLIEVRGDVPPGARVAVSNLDRLGDGALVFAVPVESVRP